MREALAAGCYCLPVSSPGLHELFGTDVATFAHFASRSNRQLASQVAGLATVAIAMVALFGAWWGPGPPLLAGWQADRPLAIPFEALCLATLGVALIRPRDDILAIAVGLAVAAVAAVDLGLDLFGSEPEASPWALFDLPSATALGVLLAGNALLLSRFERHYIAAIALGGLTGAIAVFGLLGHLTGTNTLFDATSISALPLPTAAALLCIAFGAILRTGAKPAFGQPRPLWHLLAVLGWAIVVPLLLFGAYASGRMADAQADQLRRAMIDEVTNVSSDVDREVLGEIELLQALAASPSLQNDDFAAFQRQAQAPLTMRQSGDIVLFDRGARQIVNTSAPFGTPLPQGSVRELREEVERAFATGKTQITNLYEVPGGKEFRYSIILPVKIDGEIRYALVKTPSEHSLVWTITGNQLPPSWKAVVFDSAHRILAQSEEVPEAIVGKKLPPSQWGRDGSGIVEFTDSEGTPSLQAFHQSELTGWSTAIWATKAVLGAPLQAVWQALGWMALLAFSLVVGLALWVGRIISQSVGHAARAAVALGEGRALPPNGTPVAEVNMLISELQETAAKRQAAEEAVRQSRTMFETLYEQSPDAIIVVDEIGKIDRVNAPAEALFGFSRERMLGQSIEILLPERLRNVHPAHRAGYMKEATTRPMGTGLQLSALRADGSEFPVDILLSPTNIDRRRLVLAVVRDVTERKRVEAQIQLLMRESNHRAKNILVQAIGRQTAAGSPEQFMERFTERIQALAANQDLLVSNKWQGVDLEDLLRAQLAHFADLIGARITGSGPKLRLNAATAQAIGLALHELATNAGKYGALSTDRGRVDVRWGTDGDTLTISWTERDGPPVSPPERRGFGSTVIVSMAKTTVGGEVQLDYAPSGLVWRLTCPAANALDAEENRTRGTTGKAKERLTA